MRHHRFCLAQELKIGLVLTLDRERSHYIHDVLRLSVGDQLVLFDGQGHDYQARLVVASRRGCQAELVRMLETQAESPLALTLVQAVAKGERMDWALQKAVELGVSEVQPIFTQRSEVRLSGQRLDKRQQRWRNIVRSACEQCGRATLPALHPAVTLTTWLGSTNYSGYFLDPGGEGGLAQQHAPAGALAVVVGPEGGFTEHEGDLLAQHGLRALRLGPRTLRTETAGPTAMACLQMLWGDLA